MFFLFFLAGYGGDAPVAHRGRGLARTDGAIRGGRCVARAHAPVKRASEGGLEWACALVRPPQELSLDGLG